MDIKEFAEKYKLALRRDEEGDYIIPSKLGKSHIYKYSDKLFAFVVLPKSGSPTMWNKIKKLCKDLKILQSGDAEGTIAFDPKSTEQRKLAFTAISVKRRRKISDEHKAKLLTAAAAQRFTKDKNPRLKSNGSN